MCVPEALYHWILFKGLYLLPFTLYNIRSRVYYFDLNHFKFRMSTPVTGGLASGNMCKTGQINFRALILKKIAFSLLKR